MDKAKISWLILLIYMFLIFYYSTTEELDLLKDIPEFNYKDKLFHFIEYGILGFLTFNAFKHNKFLNEKVFFYSIMLSIIYGILIEINQIFIPSREFEILDIAANTFGSLLILLKKLF